MKLLITGGTGFLGKHVKQHLSVFGTERFDIVCPTSRGLNLNDRDHTIRMITAMKPDVILHMAAKCGGILANKNSPADFFHKNIDMGSNLFEAALQADCKRIYTLGSVCAYPKFCPVPFKEDNIWNGYPEETNAPYGIAKRALLIMQQTYRQQYGFKGAHLIPVNMYGEHDHFDLTNSHVIPALIRKFDNAVVNRLPTVECWGTGEATREFLYAGDAAEGIVQAIIRELDTELPINLGTGSDISIKDLASLIGEITGFTGEIVFNGSVSDGQPKRMLDVTRAKEMLDWTARTNFREGLIRTTDWYRKNKQQIIELDAS